MLFFRVRMQMPDSTGGLEVAPELNGACNPSAAMAREPAAPADPSAQVDSLIPSITSAVVPMIRNQVRPANQRDTSTLKRRIEKGRPLLRRRGCEVNRLAFEVLLLLLSNVCFAGACNPTGSGAW
jgi:hypothetical protein